jgi:hypothetical protein
MKKKLEESWEEQFDRVTADNDGHFGHNIEFTNAKKFLKKIANFGGTYSGKLEVLDEFTIRITLPPQMSDARDKTLLLLLTEATPSECRYSKKKDQLTVEWHY